jgi:hypothetical protein
MSVDTIMCHSETWFNGIQTVQNVKKVRKRIDRSL